MSLLPPPAEPKRVMSPDGVPLATYDLGDPEAPVVLAVHGFASSAYANWIATGWVRELNREGYRVLALDQRGHGNSGKPHEPWGYTMGLLVADVQTVLDTYLVDEAAFVGYSLGARVGWHAALEGTHTITRSVLGGIPDGDPLTRFRLDEAKRFLADGTPVDDRLTQAYITMASGIPGNDLAALVALVEGMRGGLQPDPANPPQQPTLFAAGSEDRILAASERLAASAPRGEFFLIPGRNHFNAPTARDFRNRAIAFLASTADVSEAPDPQVEPARPEAPVAEDGGTLAPVSATPNAADQQATVLATVQATVQQEGSPATTEHPPAPAVPAPGPHRLWRAVSALVFDTDGRIVLRERSADGEIALILPGGDVRDGEREEEAAVRLCHEQLGGAVRVGEVVRVGYEHHAGDTVVRRMHLAAWTATPPAAPASTSPTMQHSAAVRHVPIGPGLARLQPAELIGFLLEWGDTLAREAAAG